jgi:arylsulfatase A-like enzyme
LFVGIGSLFIGAPSVSAANTKPNVLILVSDDQGWGDVGYHGGEMATPNIDKLVEDGLEMNRFYAYPICTPTRTSLLTGHISMRHEIYAPSQNLGHDPQLMNQAFKDAGYMTMTAGKWHLGRDTQRDFPINRGFDHTYGSLNAGPDYWTHGRGEVKDWGRDGRTVHENGYATDLFGNEISRLIRDRDPSKPFFSYVAFTAPHTPLQAPQEYVDKYAHIEDEDRRIYCAMVEVLDVAIGNILQAVDDEGIRDNTLVLFFSDNGGSIGADNGDFRGRKGQVYEGGTRMPAGFRWPGKIPAGVRSEQPMVVYDIFPTLVEALGIKTKLNMPFDGESVWDTLQSGKARSRKTDILIGNSTAYSVHSGEYKLIHSNVNKNTPDAPPETVELFKIYDDPNETKDLSKAHPDVVSAMIAKNSFMAEMIGNAPFRAPRGARGGARAGGGGRPGGPGGRGDNAAAAGLPAVGDRVAVGPRGGGAGGPRAPRGGGPAWGAQPTRDADGNLVHLHESIPE